MDGWSILHPTENGYSSLLVIFIWNQLPTTNYAPTNYQLPTTN
ncbi:MAG: hypothetical protein ACHBN1_37480 [Heteroscytonema crispum UTEX LB 1556]